MSDYRPWDIGKPDKADEPEADEPEALEEPGAPEPAEERAPEPTPDELETTKVSSAPGLGEQVFHTGDGGRRLAALCLLASGGFLFFSAIIAIGVTSMVVGVAEVEGDIGTANEARNVRGIMAPILFIAAAPGLTAGGGLVYHQAWARPFGQVVAGLQVLTIIGILPSILTFAGLARWRPS